MNLRDAKTIMLQTHVDAILHEERAVGIVMRSGPGIGKSDNAFEYCADLARILNEPVGLVIEMFATITSADVRGFMIPVKAAVSGDLPQTVFSLPPWYPTIANTWVVEPDGTWWARGTWEGDLPVVGVLFLDEWGQAEEEVQKPSAELIYKGNVGTAELPDKWRVIAATNRISDRSGVMRELMFLVNRRLLLNITGEVQPWIEWAERQPEGKRPHDMTITFAQRFPNVVFRDQMPEGSDPFCTPRSLCMMDKTLRALRTKDDIEHDRFPLNDLAREAAAGLIGEGAAGQFFNHIRFFSEISSLEEIEDDPKGALLPKGKDAQMVCCYMMARRVSETNASAIVTYVGRMNQEMQILALGVFNGDAKAQKVLLACREYQQLLAKHKSVLVASES